MAARKKKSNLVKDMAVAGGVATLVGLLDGSGLDIYPVIRVGAVASPTFVLTIFRGSQAFLRKYGSKEIVDGRPCDRTEEYTKGAGRGKSMLETDLRTARSSSVCLEALHTFSTSAAAAGLGYGVGYLATNLFK